MTISDPTSPSITSLSGPLTTPPTWVRGTLSLDASATDAQSGVARLDLAVDGVGGTDAHDASCLYTQPVPCPGSKSSTLSVDTTALSPGIHTVAVEARDATQQHANPNVTTSSSWSIRVDNTAPTSAFLSAPGAAGSLWHGGVTLDGGGVDGDSGVASVRFEASSDGGTTWAPLGTVASGASLPVDTTTLSDGPYSLRSVAIDAAGNTRSSATTTRRVDNTAPSVGAPVLDTAATAIRSNHTLTASASDANLTAVSFELRPAGGSWGSAIAAPSHTGSAYSSTLATGTFADGTYDLRAVASDGAGNTSTSAVLSSITIDNTAPTAPLGAVAPLVTTTGIALSSAAADATSGVQTVTFQRAPHGTTTWTDVPASGGAGPYTASVPLPADGAYDVRAQVVDAAGNTATSSAAPVTRDTTPPSLSLTGPGAATSGMAHPAASASDATAGIAGVAFSARHTGDATWTPLGTAGSAPYQVDWDTLALTAGSYDVRAVATDNAGLSTTSTTSVLVDNTPPSGTLDAPAPLVADTSVPLSATAADASSGIASVAFETAPHGSGTWDSTPATLSGGAYVASAPLPYDGVFDVRLHVVDAAGNHVRSTPTTVTRDTLGPTLALTAPAEISAAITPLAAGASDAGSGVAWVRFEQRAAGAAQWTIVGTATAPPYTAIWDTSTVSPGSYEIRAVAADNAGHTSISALAGATRPGAISVSLADPGALLSGTVVLSASLGGASNAASLGLQWSPAGSGDWQTLAVPTGPPYRATLDTRTLPDGTYDLRAAVHDPFRTGIAASTCCASRTIDNTAPALAFSLPATLPIGAVTLDAHAVDASATRVGYERAPAGTTSWELLGGPTSAPLSVTLAPGVWTIRATATDAAGNTSSQTTTTTVAGPGTDPPPGPAPPTTTPHRAAVRLRVTRHALDGHVVDLTGTASANGRLQLLAGSKLVARPAAVHGRWHARIRLARTATLTLRRPADATHLSATLQLRIRLR